MQEFRDEVSFIVPPGHMVEVMKNLKVVYNFRMLVNLTAVDYWPQETPRSI